MSKFVMSLKLHNVYTCIQMFHGKKCKLHGVPNDKQGSCSAKRSRGKFFGLCQLSLELLGALPRMRLEWCQSTSQVFSYGPRRPVCLFGVSHFLVPEQFQTYIVESHVATNHS